MKFFLFKKRFYLRQRCWKTVQYVSVVVYVILWAAALKNRSGDVLITMPDFMFYDMIKPQNDSLHVCHLSRDLLSVQNIDMFEELNLLQLKEEFKTVKSGLWRPTNCHSHQKVAIVIPYRKRWPHLLRMLKRLHIMLPKQKIDYQIFVIEQDGEESFNRAKLMNVGYVEALKIQQFDCFIFHDVDLLPENDENIYYCDEHARHLVSAIDEMRYHLMYNHYVGGVLAINKEKFWMMNGFSNTYWGWGNEDDDMSARILASDMKISRPPENIGRYKMIKHPKSWRSGNHGYEQFLRWRSRWRNDGVGSLKDKHVYELLKTIDRQVMIHLLVDIGKPPPSESAELATIPSESTYWFLSFYFP